MSLPRLDHTTHIADQLNVLAAIVKARSRAGLTDANHILETISARFFNALFDWNLANLNAELANYPAADLGDRQRRIAIQVTNADGSDKIEHTRTKAVEHGLGTDFDLLIIFFLLPKKPGFPRSFSQPPAGPKIEAWDITDLLKKSQELPDIDVLARAAKVLDEELGKVAPAHWEPKFDISRIVKYAPAELIGREDETKLLNDAWEKILRIEKGRPHILAFVALGGEGKTSLVAKWAAGLAAQDWPGCDAAFAWSFYSQGTREQVAASSDLFLKEALTFFGDDADKQFAASPAGAFEKGQRLARLVGQRRSLLILDGLEPLQYAPTSPTPGQLTDQGIAALLKGLATASHGLCVVTTRCSLPDLKAFWQTTAPEVKLLRLSREAGVHLLKTLGVKGTAQEFATLVEDVKGHALTLTLLGGFLKRAFQGDIRQRDRVKFEKADEKIDGGRAFRTMAAYEQWLLRDGGNEGRREVAVLRLMGLFDRPADAGCLAALRGETIPGLTEPLAGLADDDWEYCLSGLEAAKLLTVNHDASLALVSLDAHPLLREYFARQLREQRPKVWQVAHRRLYEYLSASTLDKKPHPTLEDLQPLYRAVAHGCYARRHNTVLWDLYYGRIQRRTHYATSVTGAFGSDLGALACFFTQLWKQPNPSLNPNTQVFVCRESAFSLRAAGRLSEASALAKVALQLASQIRDWIGATISAGLISGLSLLLGNIAEALQFGAEAVCLSGKTGQPDRHVASRCDFANALFQSGKVSESLRLFQEAEIIEAKQWPQVRMLRSMQGFAFHELLLREAERTAWMYFLSKPTRFAPQFQRDAITCKEVEVRASQTLAFEEKARDSIFSREINKLTIGRTAVYRCLIENSGEVLQSSAQNVRYAETSVAGLCRAGQQHFVPFALLTRAWLRFLTEVPTDTESAQSDLNEAWQIAERGPMRLHMADIHLHRARLFFSEEQYPWESPQADLAAAEKLINDCGYHRRDKELADAKAAILSS